MNEARAFLSSRGGALADAELTDALVAHLTAMGAMERAGPIVRLPGHAARTEARPEADALVSAVAHAEPSPPSVKELIAAGHSLELIRVACSDGRLVRISPDMVVTPAFVSRAEEVARFAAASPGGLTVSVFRATLGTSRKYALPILEYLDAHGVTRRQGDLRVLRRT